MQMARFYRSFTNMDVWEFFTNSWRTYGVAWTTFLLLGALYAIALEGLNLGVGALMDSQDFRWGTALVVSYMIVGWLMLAVTSMAMTITADRASEGQTIDFWESYGRYLSVARFWRYIWTWTLYSVIVLGGFLLFIIPGLIWTIRYVLAPYAAVVENLNAREALSRSATLTKGKTLRIFLHELGCGFLIVLVFWISFSLLIWLIAAILDEPIPLVSSADLLQIQSETSQTPPPPGWLQAIQIFAYITGQALYIIFNVLLLKSLRVERLESNQVP